MPISNKIRSLLQLKGVSVQQIAEHLQITPAAFSNKLYRGSFSAADLIKIAVALEMKISLYDDSCKVSFDVSDLEEKLK